MNNQILTALIMLLIILPLSNAALVEDIPEDQKETFDQILEPVIKIYNLVKYIATFLAALFLLFAGVNYITSGSDPKKRENAKHMIMYVAIGLIIIWAAPIFVEFIVG